MLIKNKIANISTRLFIGCPLISLFLLHMEYYSINYFNTQHHQCIYYTYRVRYSSTLSKKEGVLFMIIVSEKIKSLRIKKGLTQSELAQLLNCSSSVISSYELGTKRPSYENLTTLARIFSVSTDYLLGVENRKDPLDTSSLTSEEIQVLQQLIKVLRKK